LTIRTPKEIIASKDEEFEIAVARLEDEIQMPKKELEVFELSLPTCSRRNWVNARRN
jgi:hypothetical protein